MQDAGSEQNLLGGSLCFARSLAQVEAAGYELLACANGDCHHLRRPEAPVKYK